METNNGYVKAPHDIIRSPDLSANAKVAWLLIAGMPTGYHPTRELWMAMLPCKDKTTWQRVIKELENAGLVEVETHGTKRVYRATQRGEKTTQTKGEKTTRKGVEKPPIKGVEKPPEEGWKNPPYKKNIEEQKKNILGARARVREEVMQDMMVEMGCRSAGITVDQYHRLADLIFNDWEFQDLPDGEWTKSHFLGVLRIKARELNNGHDRKPVAASRAERAASLAAAMAALAAESGKAEKLPY